MSRYFTLLFCLLFCSVAKAGQMPALIPYVDSNGKWGYCNAAGKVLIKPQWEDAFFFEDNQAIVVVSGLGNAPIYATIDTNGNYIVPPSLHWSGNWNGWTNSMFNAHDDQGHWGLIDDKGKTIIPCEYDAVTTPPSPYLSDKNIWHRPTLSVNKKGKAGIIDTQGHTLIPFEYDYVSMDDYAYLDTALIRVQKDGKDNIIDSTGKPFLPYVYDNIFPDRNFRKGLLVRRNLKLGYVTYPGFKEVIPPEYNSINPLDSFTVVVKGEKFGLLDHDFRQCLPCEYSSIKVEGNKIRVEKNVINKAYKKQQAFIPVNTQQTASNSASPLTTYYRYFDTHDLEHGTEWKKVEAEQWAGNFNQMCCCIQRPQEIYNNTEPPSVMYKGLLTRVFEKDSIVWSTANCTPLPGTHILVSGYKKNKPDQYFCAVVNGYAEYILPPFSTSTYQMVGYNDLDSLITVSKDGQFAVLDRQYNVVLPFQKYRLAYAFRWQGKVYAVIDQRTNEISDAEPEPFHIPTEEYRLRIIKADGHLITLPKRYKAQNMCSTDGCGDVDFNSPCIWARDSAGNLGILSVTGEVLYPKISFKYKILSGVGDGYFLGPDNSNPASYQGQVYTSENKLLFPKIKVTLLQPAVPHGINNYGFSWARNKAIPHLYKATYQTQDNAHGTFYMNSSGKAYANFLE